jgi:hypothetical protein
VLVSSDDLDAAIAEVAQMSEIIPAQVGLSVVLSGTSPRPPAVSRSSPDSRGTPVGGVNSVHEPNTQQLSN